MGKVVVLGSINQDLIAVCERHPFRGETVRGMGLLRVLGGKGANQSCAAAAMGAEALIIGAVGPDADGEELLRYLRTRNVDVSHVRVNDVPTGTASIFVDLQGAISIVAVPGANAKVVDDPSVDLLAGDVLVSPLEVPLESIGAFFERGRRNGCLTILNAAPPMQVPRELTRLTDICIVDDTELAGVLSSSDSVFLDQAAIVSTARSLDLAEGGTVLVVLKSNDVLAITQESVVKWEGRTTKVVDKTGVEDCFVGTLAALLAEGKSISQAVEFAIPAAALASTRRGASMPSREEVLEDLMV